MSKFAKSDDRYLKARRALSEKYGARELWSIADHWPLYVGVANLARFMAMADLLDRTLAVPGHVAEFGTWRGANLMLLAKLLAIYDPQGNKQVHCFDSFEGLQTFAPQDGNAEGRRAAYQGSLEELDEMIELYDLEDSIVLHKGEIQQTLPSVLEAEPGLSFSFVCCDTDLYEPSRLILDALHSRLSKGGIFVFDQWNYAEWPGESIAVREFLEERGDSYDAEHVRNARQPSLVLRKTRH